MTSTRKFFLVGFEYGENLHDGSNGMYYFGLDDLFNLGKNPTELEITLAEQVEQILNLKVGETAFVNLIRDDKNSKGVVKRTN